MKIVFCCDPNAAEFKEELMEYVKELGFSIIKTKEYKTNKHVFVEPSGRKGIC